MKKFVLGALAAGVFATVSGTAMADPMENAVKARRAYYQVVLSYSRPLFGMLKGKVAYDAGKAQTLANNMKLLSETKNGHMWPKGSDNTALKGKTRALPAIWAAGSDIGAKGAAWRKAVAELAAVAGNGKDAMVEKMKVVGGTCAACHKAYRAKDF